MEKMNIRRAHKGHGASGWAPIIDWAGAPGGG